MCMSVCAVCSLCVCCACSTMRACTCGCACMCACAHACAHACKHACVCIHTNLRHWPRGAAEAGCVGKVRLDLPLHACARAFVCACEWGGGGGGVKGGGAKAVTQARTPGYASACGSEAAGRGARATRARSRLAHRSVGHDGGWGLCRLDRLGGRDGAEAAGEGRARRRQQRCGGEQQRERQRGGGHGACARGEGVESGGVRRGVTELAANFAGRGLGDSPLSSGRPTLGLGAPAHAALGPCPPPRPGCMHAEPHTCLSGAGGRGKRRGHSRSADATKHGGGTARARFSRTGVIESSHLISRAAGHRPAALARTRLRGRAAPSPSGRHRPPPARTFWARLQDSAI